MGEAPLQEGLAVCLEHAHLVSILSPVQPGTSVHRSPPSLTHSRSGESDWELPLRMLVGQRSAELAQRPVAACWPHRAAGRRRLIVALMMGLAVWALSRRLSGSLRTDPVWSKMPPLGPLPFSGRRSTDRMPYERLGA